MSKAAWRCLPLFARYKARWLPARARLLANIASSFLRPLTATTLPHVLSSPFWPCMCCWICKIWTSTCSVFIKLTFDIKNYFFNWGTHVLLVSFFFNLLLEIIFCVFFKSSIIMVLGRFLCRHQNQSMYVWLLLSFYLQCWPYIFQN